MSDKNWIILLVLLVVAYKLVKWYEAEKNFRPFTPTPPPPKPIPKVEPRKLPMSISSRNVIKNYGQSTFYALLIALAYYFLVYAKPTRPDLLTHSKSTQTDSSPEPSLPNPEEDKVSAEQVKKLQSQITALPQDQAQKERTIQGLNRSYEKLETKKDEQITNLKSQLTSLQQTQTSDQKELEKTLDQLIKGMQDLEKEI